MLNKYETIGIFASIACMVIALFLLRVEGSALTAITESGGSQTAIAVVGEDGETALRQTLVDAIDVESGAVTKLIVDDVTIGSGAAVADGDVITVHYSGRLQNGQQFDDSRRRGEAFTFEVGAGRVIEGWEEGIIGMQPGGQRILVIPPELGYGARATGPIPANSTLIFAIELLSIE